MNITSRFLPCSLATILVLTASSPAAVIAINNLTPGTQGFAASLSGPDASFFPGFTFENREVAFSFTSGPDAVLLTELTFSVNVGDPDLSPIEVTLSTGSAVPGGISAIVIGSVAPSNSLPVTQNLTIAPAVPITLSPSTEYWMHFTVPAGGGIYAMNNTNAATTLPGWALGNTWYVEPGDVWTEISSGPQARIRMSVEAVPEPGPAALSALGVIALLRRRIAR